MDFFLEAKNRALAARANARRFAEIAVQEDDEAMKSYFRHVAVSWAQSAERYEFLIEMDSHPDRSAGLVAPGLV